MSKGIVVAMVVALAAGAGCKSKAKKADEPVGSASGSAMASGSAPAPGSGTASAARSGSDAGSGSGSGSAADPGSGSAGAGSGGTAVSVTGVTACVTYAECRAAWDLTQLKNPTPKQQDEVKAAQPGYQKECNEAWPNQDKGETQKIQDCLKKHPKCPAALDCFANMAVDDDEGE